MRAAKIAGVAVLIAALGLLIFKFISSQDHKSSIASDTADYSAYFNSLRSQIFSLPDQQELDVNSLISLVPDGVDIKYDSSNFDPKTGATVVSGLKLANAKNTDVGVHIGTLLLWDVDSKALSARLAGERLDESIPLAKRIEITGLSMFGLEQLMGPMFEEANKVSKNMIEKNMGTEIIPMPDQALDKYDVSMNKLVISDLALHAWEVELREFPEKSIPSGNDFDDILYDKSNEDFFHGMQKLAAAYYAVSFENMAAYGTKMDFSLSENDEQISITIANNYIGYKGYNRGDLEYGVVDDTRFGLDIQLSSDAIKQAKDFPFSKLFGKYGTYRFGNWQLARAFNHIALGKLPARTETDFMSLGVWHFEDMEVGFDEKLLYGVESIKIDLSEFHWLIPEVLDFEIDNVKYDLNSLQSFLNVLPEELQSGDGAEIDASQMKIFGDVVDIFKKYDLGILSFDFQMAAHWEPETGKSDFMYGVGLDDFSNFRVKMDFTYPNYEAIAAEIPVDKRGNVEEVDDWISEYLTILGFELELVDEGGLEKGFAMAVDFAQLAPKGDPGMAMLQNTTPEILRNMAANGILVAMVELDKTFPPAVEYLKSFSKFIEQGGSIVFKAEPDEPLGSDEFEALETIAEDDPTAAVERLGLSVVHTPPK